MPPAAFPTKRPPPDPRGEVPEWSNGAVSKTVVGASPPRVRIPVSPPHKLLMLININDLRRVFSFSLSNLPALLCPVDFEAS